MLNQATFYNVEHQKSDLRADGYLLEPKSGGLVPLVMIVKSCAEIGRLPDPSRTRPLTGLLSRHVRGGQSKHFLRKAL